MADESFMLLSLKEKQSKKLAQVISNDTCREILDYLANHDFVTETELSKKLKIPLSTAHYNLKALSQSGLVTTDEYHYSEKGKEVPHYKLANKFIIIAPKSEEKVRDKLKRFWPISLVALVAATIIQYAQRLMSAGSEMGAMKVTAEAAPRAMAFDAVQEASIAASDVPVAVVAPLDAPLAVWFLGGAFFVIIVLVLWELVRKK